MYMTINEAVDAFVKDDQWIDLSDRKSDKVDIHALQKHFLNWSRKMKIGTMPKKAFDYVFSTKNSQRKHMRSDGLVFFSGITLLSDGVVTDRAGWMAPDFKKLLMQMVLDKNTITLGPHLQIKRSEFYEIYKAWSVENSVPVMGKIKLFEMMSDVAELRGMDIKIATTYGKNYVVRGLTATL